MNETYGDSCSPTISALRVRYDNCGKRGLAMLSQRDRGPDPRRIGDGPPLLLPGLSLAASPTGP